MAKMMISLGLFVFSLKTAPFEKQNRTTDFRWAENQRFGRGAVAQFLGPGEDNITLEGTLAPQITGGESNLSRLRLMAASGKAWLMVTGRAVPMGYWYIREISEDKTHFTDDGQARKIEFSVDLKRYFGDANSELGDLTTTILQEAIG